jgi:CRP-like cAMP-binding protein
MVVQKSLEGDGATYEVYFAVGDSDTLPSARTELFMQIQRHLRHDGISLALRGQPEVVRTPVPTIEVLLEESDLFGLLSAGGRDNLAQRFSEVHVAAGERLMSENETPTALFIIASGAVEITRTEQNQPVVVHRMSPGGTLGAIGLVTGAPYAATATAITPVRAFRLDGAGISTAIETEPTLAAELQTMAERGQAALASDAVASEAQQRGKPELLISRMRHFLEKLATRPSG